MRIKTENIFNHCLQTARMIGPDSKYNETEEYRSYISEIKTSHANFIQFHEEKSDIVNDLKSKSIPFLAFQSEKFNGDFSLFANRNSFTKDATYTAHILDKKALKLFHHDSTHLNEIKIKRVDSNIRIKDADFIANEAFQSGENKFEELFSNSLNRNDIKLYVAYIDSQPVGMAMLSNINQIFGIYWLGVRSEFRKNGTATILVSHLITIAKEENATAIVSQNNEYSKGLFQKLGFKPLKSLDIYVCY